MSAAIRAAVADFSLKGSMPLPHKYIRPGFAGSLTRTPAAANSSSRVMNSNPYRATMPTASACSRNSAYTCWSKKFEIPTARAPCVAAAPTASATVVNAEKFGGKWTWVLTSGIVGTVGSRTLLLVIWGDP
jgi:hypothetical protein